MRYSIFILFNLLVFCSGYALDAVLPSEISVAETYYSQGREFLSQGQYIRANEAFKKAEEILSRSSASDIVADSPTPINEHVVPAVSLPAVPAQDQDISDAAEAYLTGDYKKAVGIYSSLLKDNPYNMDLLYNTALAYLGNNDYKTAISILEKLLSIMPKDIDARYNLAVIYESYVGDIPQAVFHYQKYLSYCGNDRRAKDVAQWLEYLERQVR